MSKRRKDRGPAVAPVESGPASTAFELRYTADAAADIKNLDGSIRKQLRKVLEKKLAKKLAIDPEGYGLPLRGALTNYWKHEFGNHRIVYRIYPAQRVVAVCAVGVRKHGDVEEIYRQLESVAKTGRLAEQLAAVIKKLVAKEK
jgi:mRNA-degrading endonuclease RelE of RelBE toxin-antitoxin system